MTKKKSTKRALISSLLILAMCFTMLAGTTFAWFTDSVTSSGNIIKTGKLDVSMKWANGTEDPDAAAWTDASAGAIFNYDLWEPGYVDVKHIAISNDGTLALKYKVQIVANGAVTDLADVIDVYYFDPAQQIAARADLANVTAMGTLKQALEGMATTASGNLLAGEKDVITIALKMKEEAGNEYQEMSIGADFSVKLLATQYTYEPDSFDETYDANAQYPTAIINGNAITRPLTAADFTANSTIELVEPFNEEVTLPDGITVIGNGNEIHANVTGDKEITLKNVDSKYVKVTDFTGTLTFDGGTLSMKPNSTGSDSDSPFYCNTGSGTYIFKDMTVSAGSTKGIKISKAKEVVIEGCTFNADNMDPTAQAAAGQTQYVQRSLSMIDIQEQNPTDKMKVTIKNCTFVAAPQGVGVGSIADTDTAGAIKLKAESQGFDSVTITGNTFTNCYRDVVAGVNVLLNNAGTGFVQTVKNAAMIKSDLNNLENWNANISGNTTNGTADRGVLIASNNGKTKGLSEKVGEVIGGATVYNTYKTTEIQATMSAQDVYAILLDA